MLATCTRLGALLACAALMGACAFLESSTDFDNPALLAVAPETLGERTLEQRLVIRWPGGERSLEAALEISAGKLRLVLMSFGMRVSTLEYDGWTLNETRHLPQAPSGVRIVNDFLMIAAPLDALRAALPEGWAVTESKGQRVFTQGDETQIVIRYSAATPWQGQVAFEHRAFGYQLILDSHEF
ncbi:MAG: DUF3261 domain-containing protein [Zoogloeaceae bacterium]|nr:DUF3261 domain-containing protein [Zoogloeaceae bacterium]